MWYSCITCAADVDCYCHFGARVSSLRLDQKHDIQDRHVPPPQSHRWADGRHVPALARCGDSLLCPARCPQGQSAKYHGRGEAYYVLWSSSVSKLETTPPPPPLTRSKIIHLGGGMCGSLMGCDPRDGETKSLGWRLNVYI